MKVMLKVKKNNYKWEDVDVLKLKEKTILDYMEDEFDPVIASAKDDEGNNKMLVTNSKKWFEHYEEKGTLIYMVEDFRFLFESFFEQLCKEKIYTLFEGATLNCVETVVTEE